MSPDTAAARAAAKYHELAAKNPGPSGATSAYKEIDDLAYQLSQVSLFTARPVKVLCMGAGISGLSFANAVKTGQLANIDLTIYEKNSSLGGTWWENRYPGYACTLPTS